jgi:hypothetical protein
MQRVRAPQQAGRPRPIGPRASQEAVFTCERGLRYALASGDERQVRRWSRSLREAEDRLAKVEADLDRAEKRVRSEHAS